MLNLKKKFSRYFLTRDVNKNQITNFANKAN